MGLFDGVLGGVVGAGMVSIVNHVIEQHGGVQGLVSQFEQKGLGGVAQSWVSNGPSQTVTGDQVHQVLGPELLQQLSAKTGLPVQELAEKLAQALPGAIDKLTPNGQIPTA
jgi:uncharacterized protein YidB (DUF937 family)